MDKTTSSVIPQYFLRNHNIVKVIWNTKSFRWSIRNFSDICGITTFDTSKEKDNPEVDPEPSSQEYSCLLDIDFLQSPLINVGNVSEGSRSQWFFKLTKSTDDENIDLHLEFVQSGSESEFVNEEAPEPEECFFKYHIEIMASNGQSFLKKDAKKIIFLSSGKSWCEPGLVRIDHLKEHVDTVLQDDTLNLQIDLFVLKDLHHSTINGFATPLSNSSLQVKKRKHNYCYHDWNDVLGSCQLKLAKQVLNNLWNAKLSCDATIQCENESFSVHKSILSSSSPVFAAAFSHNMSESADSRIVITDTSPAIVETVLRFIYCDTNLKEPQWRNVDDLAELLNASEKYQIHPLKSMCFSKLCEELTLNNAAQITALVFLYQPDETVKTFVHQYVINNIHVLKEMESFQKKIYELPAAFTPLLLLIGNFMVV